jgi:hypothetical protein
MPSYLMRAATPVVAWVALSCAASAASAQSRLTGTILSAEARAPIAGARVAIPALALSATTDSSGRFALDGITGGEVFVLVRAVGFRPDTSLLEFAVREARELDISLAPVATVLDAVKVRGRQPEFSGKLAEFEERRLYGIGRFLDSTVIGTQRHRPTANIIASQAAGIRILRDRQSPAAYLATNRASGRLAILQGNGRCLMDVWLDGVLVFDNGANGAAFDVNSIPATQISAIELYTSPAQVPARFNKTGSICGAAVIWMR